MAATTLRQALRAAGEFRFWTETISPDEPAYHLEEIFLREPLLPGIVVLAGDDWCANNYLGHLSREKFFSSISKPFGREVFLKRPLHELLKTIPLEKLTIPDEMSLAAACRLALTRDESSRFEPIVLLGDARPIIIECADLLRAQADALERSIQEKDALMDEAARTAGELKLALSEQHALSRQLRDAKSLAEHDATHDALTGLLNYKGFFTVLGDATSVIRQQPGIDYGLLFLDLDRFKPINDSLGHQAGNNLLIQVAKRLRNVEMACNAEGGSAPERPSCIAGRHSGDEFVLACLHYGNEETVQRTAALLHRALTAPYDLYGMPVSIGISVGLVTSLKCYQNIDLAVRDADIAMYSAKRQPGTRIAKFKPRMHTVVEKRLLTETELRHAAKDGEFCLHYQPIVSSASFVPFAYEGLIRWNSRLGFLYPDQFISIAEETGSINEIGYWTLQTACIALQNDPALKGTDIRICLNVSATQLDRAELPAKFAEICAAHDVCPSRIILELTERAAATDPRHTTLLLTQLKALKFCLALDDFGTGHSSLSWLHHFPVDILKVDRCFFTEIEQSATARKIAAGILGLCGSLGVTAIAEGVERPSQAECLAELGFPFMQGYHFGRPEASIGGGKAVFVAGAKLAGPGLWERNLPPVH